MELASDFRHPPLRVSARSLEDHFASDVARALTPLRNPHHEPSVDDAARRSATPAAVLIPVVLHESGLTLLLTRRHAEISYPGHLCFPGGRADPGDATPVDTAVREAREEIALAPERVKVIGRLGNYVTHSGFRITPVVGLVKPPLQLVPREREVEEILEIPLAAVFDSRSYRLRRARAGHPNAVFILEWGEAVVTGPTVSLMMGLYEQLLLTHAPLTRRR